MMLVDPTPRTSDPSKPVEPVSGYGTMGKFYQKVDKKLDDIFPGRQARQDLRAEAKAYRQAARLDRKKGRVDARNAKIL